MRDYNRELATKQYYNEKVRDAFKNDHMLKGNAYHLVAWLKV